MNNKRIDIDLPILDTSNPDFPRILRLNWLLIAEEKMNTTIHRLLILDVYDSAFIRPHSQYEFPHHVIE